MGLIQPAVRPLPKGLSLKDQVIIVTGASGGLGLETARQALALQASVVVLACRNMDKGAATKKQLLGDAAVRKNNPKASVKVMRVDMDDYASVQAFTASVQAELPRVDVLLLNAGIGFLPKFEISSSGHERNLQVNFLSNALLLAELLPHLQASAKRFGPVHVTWVGSRRFINDTTVVSKIPARDDETVLQRLDDRNRYSWMQQYSDSKLMCVMWFYELCRRLEDGEREHGSSKLILNMVCPGMIDTGLSNNLPFAMRAFATVVKAVRARPVEQGGWMLLNAAAVLGPESHGKFIGDNDIMEQAPVIVSTAGKKLAQRIWNDTAVEISKLTTLPPELKA